MLALGLLHQPADPAGHGAGHRAGGGRRHRGGGERPSPHRGGEASRTDAAIQGARELAVPIIAMTTTLVAVYAPIGFMGGLVGTLFTEFAFSLAAAVLISGVVALTLSPMLSALVLKPGGPGRALRARRRALLHRAGQRLRALPARAAALPVGHAGLCRGDPGQHLVHVHHQPQRAGPDRGPEHPVLPGHRAPDRDGGLRTSLCGRDPQGLRDHPRVQGGLHPGGHGGRPQRHLRRLQDALGVGAQPLADGRSCRSCRASSRPSAGWTWRSSRAPACRGPGAASPCSSSSTTEADYRELDKVAGDLVGRAMGSGKFMFLRKSVEFTRPRTTRPDRPRPRRGPRHLHAGDRAQPVPHARRGLRQPLQPGGAQLSGHPPGGPRRPAGPGHARRLLRAGRERGPGPPGQPGALRGPGRAQQAQPVPAAQLASPWRGSWPPG